MSASTTDQSPEEEAAREDQDERARAVSQEANVVSPDAAEPSGRSGPSSPEEDRHVEIMADDEGEKTEEPQEDNDVTEEEPAAPVTRSNHHPLPPRVTKH